MYLRKSRMDTDYEEISITENLSRHRITLEKLCKSKRLHVDEVLEEVVSGESLAARPQMMRLLEMVSTGDYAGVVCMDIERLSRGSSMESGYIMQILQINGCKIVTPGKTYDLQNESDEQFTDMKFMFSRYELKTITKRLVRGRNQSVSEGKFMDSMAPYGYRAYKLPGEKGNSLMVIPEEAKVVQMIFDMYGQQGMGYNAIAYKESPTAWFRCMTRNCDCKMIKCGVAEKNILNAMEEWLEEYQIQLAQTQTQAVDPIDTALETVRSQLAGLQLQQEKICEYLEKGIYSVEMFSKRNTALSKEIEQLRESETDLLRQKSEGNKRNRAAAELIPTTQHILDSYDALTVEEKNSLWKPVMTRAMIYREPEGEVRIQIYPNLPR